MPEILVPKLRDSGRGRRLVYITSASLMDILKDFTRPEDVPEDSRIIKLRYVAHSRKLGIMIASRNLPHGKTDQMLLNVDLSAGGLTPK